MSSMKFLSPFIRNHGFKLRKSRYYLETSYRPAAAASTDGEFCSCPAATLQQTRTMATDKRCLNIEDLNPNVRVMEYAVRGPLVIRAAELEKELEKVNYK